MQNRLTALTFLCLTLNHLGFGQDDKVLETFVITAQYEETSKEKAVKFRDIIKISSVTLYFQNGAMSIYASTKNGLNSLSRVTQTELAFSNNNVNCTLCILGAVNTGIDKRTKTVDGKIGSV